jgi:hypothetical protein
MTSRGQPGNHSSACLGEPDRHVDRLAGALRMSPCNERQYIDSARLKPSIPAFSSSARCFLRREHQWVHTSRLDVDVEEERRPDSQALLN